jgi:hypothetical protein
LAILEGGGTAMLRMMNKHAGLGSHTRRWIIPTFRAPQGKDNNFNDFMSPAFRRHPRQEAKSFVSKIAVDPGITGLER